MNTTAGLLQDPVSSFSNGHSNLISNQLSEAHNSAANVTTQSSATIYGKSGGLSTSNYVIAALYWSIFIFGCLGNSFVLLVTTWSYNGVGKKQAMFKFTCSLAISDLGLLLGVAWINALLSINPAWRFGDGMCKLYTIWRSLTSNTSIWILMAIAVDRLLGMSRPAGAFITNRGATVIVVVSWTYHVSVNFVQFFWAEVVPSVRSSQDCQMPYVSVNVLTTYTWITSIVNFFVPLAVTWCAYIGIIVKTWKSKTKMNMAQVHPAANVHDATYAASAKSVNQTARVTTTCLTIATTFTMCWTPFEISLLLIVNNPLLALKAPYLLRWLTVLACSNSCVNPIIYGLMWRTFRQAVSGMFAKLHCGITQGKHFKKTTSVKTQFTSAI